jgi:hypothetical protein
MQHPNGSKTASKYAQRRVQIRMTRLYLVSCLAVSLTSIASAQTQPVCSALASTQNLLYLVAADGTVISRFSAAGQPKTSISLSPDGKKIAFIPNANPDSFTISDITGRTVNFPVQQSAQGAFTAVSWDSANVLKVQYHASLENDVFQFLSAPSDFANPLPKLGSTIAGVNCSLKEAGDSLTACLSENKLVANKKILLNQNPLSPANVSVITTAQITLGTAFSTQTSPSFQVRLQSIEDGVTLRITLPDGSWTESRVPVGAPLPVTWDDNTYGFTATALDAQKRTATISITRKNPTAPTMDPVVTWSGSNYITVVSRSDAQAQLQLVKSSGNQGPMSASLGSIEQVSSIIYDTPTLLMLRTKSQYLVVQINSVAGNTSRFEIVNLWPLPTTLNVKLAGGVATASVEGWTCH